MHNTFSKLLSIVNGVHQRYVPSCLPTRTKAILDGLIDTTRNFQVSTYQKYAKAEGWEPTPLNIIWHFKSVEGKIIFLPKENLYILFYNRDRLIERKKWTIAHELGHYFCGHLLRNYTAPPASLEDAKQREREQEAEANRFASCLLVPPWVLVEAAGRYGRKDVMAFYSLCRCIFRLSKEASYFVARNTASTFQKYGIQVLRKHWDTMHEKYHPVLSTSLYTIFHTCQDFDSFVRAYNHEYDMLNLLHTGNMLGTLMHGPYSIAQCMGLD